MNQDHENTKIVIEKNLAELLHKLDLVFNRINIEKKEDDLFVANISSSEEASMIIGKNGENMISLQRVLKLMVQKELGEKVSITLDSDNYRQRREEGAISEAKIKAKKCLSTGELQRLEPMPAYVRRAIHLFFRDKSEFNSIDTRSSGVGNARCIEIFSKGVAKEAPDNSKKSSDSGSEPKSKKEEFKELEEIEELMDF